MRIVAVDNIAPDMVLARTISHNDGRILLNEGCTDLFRFKDRLKAYGIYYVYIDDEYSADIIIDDAISEQTRVKCKRIIAETTKSIVVSGNINIELVRHAVSDIVEEILSNKKVLMNLTDIKSNDDYTFAHSVNVSMISIVIGKLLNFSYKDLLNLGTGSLMHDMGKAVIPSEILNKPGKLTEEEYKLIKEHPQLGFDMVKHSHDMNPLSRVAILTHHEKFDGTGYPNRLKGKDIHLHGRIVAIADVFDALTSNRIYRGKWPIYQAVEYISALSGTQFDKDIVDTFIHNVAAYPNGSVVILSTGEKAIVKDQNANYPTRPIIRIFQDKSGKPVLRELDLSNEPSIVILDTE